MNGFALVWQPEVAQTLTTIRYIHTSLECSLDAGVKTGAFISKAFLTLAVWCSTLVLARVDWLGVNPSTMERNGETYCKWFGKLEEQRTGIFLSSRRKIKNFRFGAGLRVVGAPRDRSQVRIASAIYCTWPKALNAVSSSRRAV